MAQVAEGAKTAGATRIIGVDIDATKFERGEASRSTCLSLSPSRGSEKAFFCGGADALTAHCPFLHASLSACGLFFVLRQMSSATLYVQYF